MHKKLYVNPLPVRILHWVNALGFVLLIATGVQIRYVGQIDVVSFKTAVEWHNWIGFALIGNFFLWLFYHLFTDKIRVYLPELDREKYFKATFAQMRYYGWGIFVGDPNPHRVGVYKKFNPMQGMMYTIVMMLLLPLQFFTGLLLWDVVRFSTIVDFFGGVRMVDTVHVLLFVFFSGFIVAHFYMGMLGHTTWAHFKAMFTGYEEVEDEAAAGSGR